jgi:hypothetical protein
VTIEKEALVKAAEAVQRRAAQQQIRQMSREERQALIRSGPLWATLSNPPGPGEPIPREVLRELMRNWRIAQAMGIES